MTELVTVCPHYHYHYNRIKKVEFSYIRELLVSADINHTIIQIKGENIFG